MPEHDHPHAYLGVDASLTGRRWIGPSVELSRQSEALSQQTRLPDALCRVLARRGVAADQTQGYLAPALRDLLPDPRSLRDMEKAAARFLQAATSTQRIAVFADYDVDGATSATLLVDWLRQMGRPATLYIPDRIDEGYGPNIPAITALSAAHDLILCVDCGTLSHEALAVSTCDVVVLDHHLAGETLPAVHAVVNPNRQDETGDLSHLCAAAVVFLMLVEAGRQLREAGQKGPDLMAMLDLVALGTVADVAPLIGVNRAFVRQGLTVMARRARPGLVALGDVAGMNTAPTPYHLGYLLGPRINAGGRIGKADLGARLLACTDPAEAQSIAEKLDLLNRDRREIETSVTAAAMAQAEARGTDRGLVWAAGEGWHPGVVGIVASRLKEAFNRPAVVIGLDEDEGKGSGRSVSGIDLGASVQRLASEGLLLKGGGHKMAAGLSIARANLDPAMARLTELMEKQGAHLMGPRDLLLDGVLMPGAAQVALIAQIDQAGPFGASSAAPRFAFPDMRILNARRVGETHLKITFGDGLGAKLDAIAFGAFDTALGPALENHGGQKFHLAGRLEINHWNGRQSPQMRLEDASRA